MNIYIQTLPTSRIFNTSPLLSSSLLYVRARTLSITLPLTHSLPPSLTHINIPHPVLLEGADGDIILWDTVTKDYGKIGDRRIETIKSRDDHFRTIEVAYKGTQPIIGILEVAYKDTAHNL